MGTAMDEEVNESQGSHGEEAVGTGITYFEAHKGAVTTSNFTLSSLSVSAPEELHQALSSFRQRDPLREVQDAQSLDFQSRHSWFEYLLNAGNSLLIYGLGSKRSLLDDFATELTSTSDVVVIHGYNPTSNLRSILTQIATELFGLRSFSKRSLLDYVDAIREQIEHKQTQKPKQFSKTSRQRGAKTSNKKCNPLIPSNTFDLSPNVLSIVVHNIDGPSLRTADAQLALSRLASIQGVRLIASIDHVNAALLWDASACAGFSWMWVPCHTLQPYEAETFFAPRPLGRGGVERRVEGAVAMLNSLTKNARNAFRELVIRQMDGSDSAASAKTTFNDLFEALKEAFIVSDPEALRGILNELQTHDLLQTRTRPDASQLLWIPLPDSQLEDVLNEIGLEE